MPGYTATDRFGNPSRPMMGGGINTTGMKTSPYMQPVDTSGSTTLGQFKTNLDRAGVGYDPILNDFSRGGLAGMTPGVFYGIQQQNARLPQYYDAINQALQQMNPQTNQAQVNAMRVNGLGQAQDQARALIASLLQGGMGIGARQGAGISAQNQANAQAGNYAAQMASPEAQQKQIETIMQLQQMAMQNPMLAEALQYFNAMLGRESQDNQNRQSSGGGGLFGSLGQLAGMAAPFVGGPAKIALAAGGAAGTGGFLGGGNGGFGGSGFGGSR